MSHFSKIQTAMSDPKYLRPALADLGFQYEESEEGTLEVVGFGRQRQPVNFRVKLPLSGDVGLRKRGPNYEIVADWFTVRGMNEKDFTQKLSQRYAYHATRDKMTSQGFDMVEETVEETGQIRIVMRRMA